MSLRQSQGARVADDDVRAPRRQDTQARRAQRGRTQHKTACRPQAGRRLRRGAPRRRLPLSDSRCTPSRRPHPNMDRALSASFSRPRLERSPPQERCPRRSYRGPPGVPPGDTRGRARAILLSPGSDPRAAQFLRVPSRRRTSSSSLPLALWARRASTGTRKAPAETPVRSRADTECRTWETPNDPRGDQRCSGCSGRTAHGPETPARSRSSRGCVRFVPSRSARTRPRYRGRRWTQPTPGCRTGPRWIPRRWRLTSPLCPRPCGAQTALLFPCRYRVAGVDSRSSSRACISRVGNVTPGRPGRPDNGHVYHTLCPCWRVG